MHSLLTYLPTYLLLRTAVGRFFCIEQTMCKPEASAFTGQARKKKQWCLPIH